MNTHIYIYTCIHLEHLDVFIYSFLLRDEHPFTSCVLLSIKGLHVLTHPQMRILVLLLRADRGQNLELA